MGFDLLEILRQGVFEVTGRKPQDISAETAFADLALDSVMIMELVCFVEEKLSIHLPDEALARLNTVSDLDRAVAPLLERQRAQKASAGE